MRQQAFQRYKELHLGQLRAFCECIRHKSYSAAARALRMSQPAVWQQVRALERDFGVSLVQRRNRQLEPSEDGLVLLELASSIVGSMDTLKELFDQRRKDVPRTVTVIGSPGVILEELALPVVSLSEEENRELLKQKKMRDMKDSPQSPTGGEQPSEKRPMRK